MDKLERLVETLKLIATSAPPKDHCEGNVKEGLANCDQEGALTLEETMQNYDIDADTLMQKFCLILSHETLKYEFYWNAESIFVDYMCREYNWLLGAEGYALVTLQQAIRSICPPTARAPAARTGSDEIHNNLIQKKPEMSLYSNSSRDDSRDDDTRSMYSSRDDDDRGFDTLGLSVHNSETLISSSSKLKGIAMSPKPSIPVLGSE
jgi:hypothetical protein